MFHSKIKTAAVVTAVAAAGVLATVLPASAASAAVTPDGRGGYNRVVDPAVSAAAVTPDGRGGYNRVVDPAVSAAAVTPDGRGGYNSVNV